VGSVAGDPEQNHHGPDAADEIISVIVQVMRQLATHNWLR
jgi:hypothetical protein